jgi:hypothetical protein
MFTTSRLPETLDSSSDEDVHLMGQSNLPSILLLNTSILVTKFHSDSVAKLDFYTHTTITHLKSRKSDKTRYVNQIMQN